MGAGAAVCMYAFIGTVYDGPLALMAQALHLQVAPSFDKPYLSDSVESFWGRRWNLPMSLCLREAIYEPISQGQLHALTWTKHRQVQCWQGGDAAPHACRFWHACILQGRCLHFPRQMLALFKADACIGACILQAAAADETAWQQLIAPAHA